MQLIRGSVLTPPLLLIPLFLFLLLFLPIIASSRSFGPVVALPKDPMEDETLSDPALSQSQSSHMTGALAMVSSLCQRCGSRVYQMEKVGPVNGVLFHRQCFTCRSCGHHLNLRSYFTNQNLPTDKEVYCSTHHPKASAYGFDAQAVCIRSALSAPYRGPGCNGQIRGTGETPRVGLDALHIQTPLTSQTHFEKKTGTRNDKYHFPSSMVSAGGSETLYQYQRDLELVQRGEEDRMMRSFRLKRQQEALTIKKEMDEEWQERLRDLVDKYNNRRQKNRKAKDDPSGGLEFEREALRRTLTMKMAKKKEALSLKLAKEQQRETASMVEKHSRQMLQLIHSSNHQEQLRDELHLELGRESYDGLEEALRMLESSPQPPPPPPHPPRCRKRDLYLDPSVFSDLDQEAFMTAESEQSTFTDLVKQLTARCANELEKARAIFRWITVKNLDVMEFDETIEQDTPFGILRGIKYGTETYHTLFLRLCSYAGLVCVEIHGHSKSVGYEPGMTIDNDQFLNTWNAVLIYGDWRPVQCNWGARHLVQNKDTKSKPRQDKIQYEYDDHYFLTDPDEFIQEFWASDPRWQLLDRPISLEAFERLPFVRSVFFHYGLEFDGAFASTLETDSAGGTAVRIRFPEEHSKDIVFHYQLRLTDSSLPSGNDLEYNGEKLERYVYHSVERTTALFSVHVPDVGSYHLEIFTTRTTTTCDSTPGVKANGVDCPTTTTASTRTSPFRLKCSCKFQIVCNQLTSGRMLPLPECVAGEWGPAKAWRNFGMEALTHTDGIIYVDSNDDHLEIRFRCSDRYQVKCRLRSSHVTVDQALQGQAKVERLANDIVAVRLRLDGAGQYGIDLYVRCDGQTLHHACKYLVNCKRRDGANGSDAAGPDGIPGPPSKQQLITPLALGRVWGPTPAFKEFELQTISHATPSIELRKPGTLSVILGSDKPVKLNAILRRVSDNGGGEEEGVLSSRVTTKDYGGSKKKKTKFNVEIHRFDHGMLALEIYANAGSEAINVYNYVIVKHPDQTAYEKRGGKGSFHL